MPFCGIVGQAHEDGSEGEEGRALCVRKIESDGSTGKSSTTREFVWWDSQNSNIWKGAERSLEPEEQDWHACLCPCFGLES